MKLTIRNTKVRNDRGQMVNATFLGAGSITEEVNSWLENNPDVITDSAVQGVTDWLEENITQPTTPVIDASLSVGGAAADAKKTGDEISDLKRAFIYKNVTGSLIRIDDNFNGKFDSLKIFVPPDQDGEGDPSTENIRPFIRHNLNVNGIGIPCNILNGNLFRVTYEDGTASGVTKTRNNDGSVTFNGTTTTASDILFNVGLFALPAGRYKFFGMPELEDGVAFRYRMNANTIGGSLIRYFETDGTIFELTEKTKVGIRAYVTAPTGTDVDIDIYPIIRLADDPNEEFTITKPDDNYSLRYITSISTYYVAGVFELSSDPTVGYYREFKRYTSYNGETLTGKWVSDRDVYTVGGTPTIGADVIDLETTEDTVYTLTSNNGYGLSLPYKNTYIFSYTDEYIIDTSYVTNRTVDYPSLDRLRYRPHLFDTVSMKLIKTIPLYTDSYGNYYVNGMTVTDKYIVLAVIPPKASAIAEAVNLFMAFDKDTLEEASIGTKVVTMSEIGIERSHANNMTFIPSANEIYVRTGRSRKAIVLDAETLDVKRIETMPHNGGCAYDPITDQWAFLAAVSGVTTLTITNSTKDTILKTVKINNQGYTQGICFYDGIIFVPTSVDTLRKGNSIVAVNTDGVVMADWWFDGGDEFEDVEVMDDFRLLLSTTSSTNGYRVYSAIYKPFNVQTAEIKSYDIYRTSTIE